MALTKSEIVNRLYRNDGWTRRRAAQLVESLLDEMKTVMKAGDDILVSGFGRFRILDKAERPGRNPYTGDKMTLRARRVITFKPSRVLKKDMND